MEDLQKRFTAIGATFVRSVEEMAAKLRDVHCFIFDWDGVFNRGIKTNQEGSPFSEPDSMGLNMLRFAYWLQHQKLPYVAIVTGANNETARAFAEREHLHAVILNAKHKEEAFKELLSENGLEAEQCAFVFDDILDLGIARIAGLRFCIRRASSPLFEKYITENKLCDYISGSSGGQHAVREVSELMMGMYGNYYEVLDKRIAFSGPYQDYLQQRNQIVLK